MDLNLQALPHPAHRFENQRYLRILGRRFVLPGSVTMGALGYFFSLEHRARQLNSTGYRPIERGNFYLHRQWFERAGVNQPSSVKLNTEGYFNLALAPGVSLRSTAQPETTAVHSCTPSRI